MSDEQREALAALAVGETHTLVDRVDMPEGATRVQRAARGREICFVAVGLDGFGMMGITPPHGKTGDVITVAVKLLPYRFLIKSVEVKRDDQLSKAELVASGIWQGVVECGDPHPDGEDSYWITTVERTQ